ncbi:hypothetical protein [Streptomyces hokutonensis]|uniref:hypothetical protein n=1 Tax=Streptomyces hokutonensis TaxID=1306990 RepID=UPI00036B4BE8|nr:hypothetical protein [Streptomyces hokutonensis]
MSTPQHTEYDRALTADHRLRALAQLVTALCQFVRPADTMCGGCAWDALVKPLATPLIGWERGYKPEAAKDPDPDRAWRIYTGGEWLAGWKEAEQDRTPASTDTEQWLRTSEAWDAYCGELIRQLNAADPAHGHGIQRYGKAKTIAA